MANRDEGFKAWLSMQEYYLDEFFMEDVPRMPEDPFSEEGLKIAEQAALDRFGTIDEAIADREVYDRFVRFIGECFVRGLGGSWTDSFEPGDMDYFLGVALPWNSHPMEIPTLYTAAVHRRTGDEWAFVYRMQAKQKARASA